VAVLREGSEAVLFVYGIAASGAGRGELAAGVALGVLSGVGIGAALYLGLLRIPTRHLFSVTTALLVLLAAGMAAQAAAFLVQAGVLPALRPVMWDSSAILSQSSLLGQMLHTLVGYADRPSGMQLLVYGAVVTIIGGLTLATRRASALLPVTVVAAVLVAAVSLVTLLMPPTAHASRMGWTPIVAPGATPLELRGPADLDRDAARDNARV
jgi:high-affinity iron transporter